MDAKTKQMYSLLELEPGASPEEVKKAYFRLVRRYNPEREPEKFQEIRAAYELLKDGVPEDSSNPDDSWMKWDHPVIGYLIQLADKAADEEDYKKAVDLIEDAEAIEPDNPLIHLLKARYLLHDDHLQLAARSAEIVVQSVPDNQEAWMILANALINRGWYRKALPAFRRAMELTNAPSTDFLIGYGQCLARNNFSDEANQVFRDLLSSAEWEHKSPEDALICYTGIADWLPPDPELLELLLDHYDQFVQAHRRQLRDTEFVTNPIMSLCWQDSAWYTVPGIRRRIEATIHNLRTLDIIPEQIEKFLIFSMDEHSRKHDENKTAESGRGRKGRGSESYPDDRDFDTETWDSRWRTEPQEPVVRDKPKVGRNDPCPCGSGKKFKKCCMGKGVYD